MQMCASQSLYVFLSCYLFLCFLVLFVSFDSNYDDNDNGYVCLYISEERRGMNLSGSESGEDMGGSVEGKTIIRIDCVKINF